MSSAVLSRTVSVQFDTVLVGIAQIKRLADENGVELYRDRPKEDWPRAADGSLSMFTKRLDLDDLLRARES